MILALALLGMSILPAIFMMRWRGCFILVLYLVILEGAVRKWVFPSAHMYIFFIKDFVLLIAYWKYFVEGRINALTLVQTLPPLFRVQLLLTCGYCILEIANPYLGSPIVGLLGVRNYILYIPAIFLVGDLFLSEEQLLGFLRRYALVIYPVIGIAIVQHLSPPTSLINRYANPDAVSGIAMVGSAVRTTGTFSYIAGYTTYIHVMLSLVIPLLLIEQPGRWRMLLWGAFSGLFLGAAVSGSRGLLVTGILMLLAYLLLNRVVWLLGLYRKILVPVVISIFVFAFFLSPVLENIQGRFRRSSDVESRIIRNYVVPWEFVETAGLFGFGVGATYPAADALRQSFGIPKVNAFSLFSESEAERIVLELGLIGALLWYTLRITLLVQLWSLYRRSRKPLCRELALGAFVLHLSTMSSHLVFQATFLVYYWWSAGFLILLPRLERQPARNV